jgi:ATP-dependent 26S proteasome regulatory subunit
VQVGKPDEQGRLEVLNVHTSAMRASGRLNPDAASQMPDIARCVAHACVVTSMQPHKAFFVS